MNTSIDSPSLETQEQVPDISSIQLESSTVQVESETSSVQVEVVEEVSSVQVEVVEEVSTEQVEEQCSAPTEQEESAGAAQEEESTPAASRINLVEEVTAEKEQIKDHKKASELKAEGNRLFAAGNLHAAIDIYTEAIEVLPEGDEHSYARAVFHNNRAACHMRLEHYDQALEDCTVAVELSPTYLKAFMRRAQAYEKLEELDSALKDMNQVVAIDPSFLKGQQEQARLDVAVKKRNEELKEEMLGKLKSLGNTVLGKFGMSLDNFKVNQDPNTGSYSVNFQQ